jgi:hypothetical protein
MNVRWLRAPLLAAMVVGTTLAGTGVAQASPQVEARVVIGNGHRYAGRVVYEDRRPSWRYRRAYQRRYCWYDRWHRPHYYYRTYYR